jgi:hypothetical protein
MEVHASCETRDETKKNPEPQIVPFGVVVEELSRIDQGASAARRSLLYSFVFIIRARNFEDLGHSLDASNLVGRAPIFRTGRSQAEIPLQIVSLEMCVIGETPSGFLSEWRIS